MQADWTTHWQPTHDNVEVRVLGDSAIERDDVGVLQFRHDANLCGKKTWSNKIILQGTLNGSQSMCKAVYLFSYPFIIGHLLDGDSFVVPVTFQNLAKSSQTDFLSQHKVSKLDSMHLHQSKDLVKYGIVHLI